MFSKIQKAVICFLVGTFCFLLPYQYLHTFFSKSDFNIFLLKTIIGMGGLCLALGFNSLLNSKFKGFITVLTLEILFYTFYQYTTIFGKGRRFEDAASHGIAFYTTAQYNPSLGTYDPELFYKLKPNAKGMVVGRTYKNHYTTNSFGLRDDENSLEKPEIIALGDSHTMGMGVNNDENYCHYLEQKINRKILNAGIISYGTAREFELLKQLDTTNCKLIILQYCDNDFEENKTFFENKNTLVISNEATYNEIVRFSSISLNYYPFQYIQLYSQYLFFRLKSIVPTATQSKKSVSVPNQLHEMDAFINVLKQIRAYTNINILVFCLETTADYKNHTLYKKIEAKLKQNPIQNVYCNNIISDFTLEDIILGDGHPNKKGHEKIARNINTYLDNNSQLLEK